MQAIAMLRGGLDVTGAELALVGASHAGEAFHRQAVVSILEGCGLTVDALQTPPSLPWDEEALVEWVRQGHGREPVAHNCSGKHAGMLRTCVRAGWSLHDYRDAAHPLQRSTRAALAQYTGEPVGDPVVDGCGAPAFAVTLTGLARSFGRLASADDGEARPIADAFRRYPEHASGTRRDEVVFHHEVPGLVCKLGAEGAFAAGLPDGTGIAVKTADGNHRGNIPVLVGVLAALGLATDALLALAPHPVLGHGRPVGRVHLHTATERSLARLAAG
ncbi:asparaginase [Tessaracoccus coleopterorum]|uniref:asparaginase n=1 Tax=Tessaracoccus coleopterorum TaxID=2714950 RepID=UPI0018D37496